MLEQKHLKVENRSRGLSSSSESGYHSDSAENLCKFIGNQSDSDQVSTPKCNATANLPPIRSDASIPTRSLRHTISSKTIVPSRAPPRLLRRVKSSASITIDPAAELDFIPPPVPRRTVSQSTGTKDRTLALSPLAVITVTPVSAPEESMWTRSLRRGVSAFQLSTRFITLEPTPPVPTQHYIPATAATMLEALLIRENEAIANGINWDFGDDQRDAVEIDTEVSSAQVEQDLERRLSPPSSNGSLRSTRSKKGKKAAAALAPPVPSLRRYRSFFDPTTSSPHFSPTLPTVKHRRSASTLRPPVLSHSQTHTGILPPLDPIFSALERNSRVTIEGKCDACAKVEINLSTCPRCLRTYCSRKCRVSMDQGGHRHICVRYEVEMEVQG